MPPPRSLDRRTLLKLAAAGSAASALGARSPRAVSNPDARSPRAVSNPDARSPRAAPNPDARSPRAAPNPDARSPRAAPNPDARSPRAGRRGDRPPNVVLIMADEQSASVLGCYGDPLVRTPHVDALARQGIRFSSAYCNSPLCVPARLAFATGRYVSRIGAWNNNSWLVDPDQPTVASVLEGAGYDALLCGKMHFDRSRRYGFEELGESKNQGLKTGLGERRAADDLEPGRGYSGRLRNARPGDSWLLEHDREVTRTVTSFLRERGRDDPPFFLTVGYFAPHFPLVVPERYWRPYRGRVPLPDVPEGHVDALPLNYRHLRIAFNVEDVPDAVTRRARELYYGMVHWLDEQIGRVLDAIENTGLAEDTLVIYTADHGESLGEHGLWWKSSMFEGSVRVPLIVRWPARWPTDRRGGELRREACSLVDLLPTLAEVAGAELEGPCDGDSMLAWLDDRAAGWKDLAVSEFYGPKVASGFAMLRRGRHKYVYHTPPDAEHPAERELYDLEADPRELANLARDPDAGSRAALDALHAALVDELGEHPDATEQRCRREHAQVYSRVDADGAGSSDAAERSGAGDR